MKKEKLRFLFINSKKQFKSSFIRKDLKLISKVGKVIYYQNIPSLSNLLGNILSLPRLIKKARNCDFIYGWWLYNYLAILVGIFARKPVILIAGGGDTAKIPEINYGELNYPLRRLIIKFNLNFVYYIRFVNFHLKIQLENNLKKEIKNYFILATHYDHEFWIPDSLDKQFITTVSTNPHKNKKKFYTRFLVKGLDRFLKLANKYPEEDFLLIGTNEELLRTFIKKIPSNIKIIGKISEKELLNYYQQTKLYCQFSRHEGLSNVVCEVLLCGCQVLASNVSGITSAVDKFATIIDFNNKNIWRIIRSKLSDMMDEKNFLNRNGREYIIKKYNKEIIIQKIKEIFSIL